MSRKVFSLLSSCMRYVVLVSTASNLLPHVWPDLNRQIAITVHVKHIVATGRHEMKVFYIRLVIFALQGTDGKEEWKKTTFHY